MKIIFYLALFCAFQLTYSKDKAAKQLSIFNVVTFPNDSCSPSGSSSKNGTCYTKEECSNKGGSESGTCAQGFGVCCIFTARCGNTYSENCTYFESTGSEPAGPCKMSVCPCNNNICQLRLDFISFVISGPSTQTVSAAKITQAVSGVSTKTQCLTDTFTVTSSAGNSPPTICGTNTGEHMYVPVSGNECVDLNFVLGAVAGTASTLVTARNWNVKITQYGCDSRLLAPAGCTQYFYGSTTGIVKTFNFDGGVHLANQNQNICVRREAGNCRICYFHTAATDFEVSKTNTKAECCLYNIYGVAAAAAMKTQKDCVIIPGPISDGNAVTPAQTSKYCGNSGLAEVAAAKTLCTRSQPFNIQFNSDGYEFTNDGAAGMEAALSQKGFKLNFAQDAQGGC